MLNSLHRKLFFTVPQLSHLSPSDQQQKLLELQSLYNQRFTKEFQQQTRDLKNSFTTEQLEKIDLIHEQILKMNTFEILALRKSVQSTQPSEYDWPIFSRPNESKYNLTKGTEIPTVGAVASISDLVSKLTAIGAVKQEEVKVVEEVVIEKTTFNIVLTGYDANSKVKFIRSIKDILGLGLKESKDKVEEVAKGPVILFKSVSKESHGKILETLIAAGGKVEFQ